MKKIFILPLLLLTFLLFLTVGCSIEKEYSITMNSPRFLYEDLPSSARPGEVVNMKILKATDMGYLVFVNGSVLGKEAYSEGDEYWQFSFVMPNEDVEISFKTYDGFLPHPNYGKLIETFWILNPDAEYVRVREYYGEYSSGAVVAMIDSSDYAANEWSEDIAGYTFKYGDGNCIQVLHEGRFYKLAGAYMKGILSKSDIESVYNLYTDATPKDSYTLLILESDKPSYVEPPQAMYRVGDAVKVVVGTVTETNQYLWVNDERKSPTDRNLTYTTFTFEMPACDVVLKLEEQSVDIPLPPEERKIVDTSNQAVTDFAIRLFKKSIEEGENTLISPLSVLTALSMTANGADNKTLAQMEEVLGMPIEQLNAWISDYMKSLPSDEKYKLSLANSIWFTEDERFEVNESFLKTNSEFYSSGVYRVPFDDATLKKINAWVENNTDGMIKNILDEIPKNAVMYLINALAFDAKWQDEYTEYQVRDGEFTREDGEKENVEMMHSEEGVYLEDENAKGVIKYYKDRKYAFVALLPNEATSIAEYVEGLDGERIVNILSNAKTSTVYTSIPKFETDYSKEMSQVLEKMGMTDAFNEEIADFARLGRSSAGNIFINRVIHKTFIRVDESGTKAGAATVVEMADECAPVVIDPKEVILDRPFVYMLIDCKTNIPFFIGTVMSVK